jgi:hypothetical protein
MMKIKLIAGSAAILLFCFGFAALPAFATGDQNHECQGGHNCNNGEDGSITVEQTQLQSSWADAEASAGASASSGSEATSESISEGGSASASNEGIDIDASENNSIENNSSNVVLVPNNNTESCVRVFGVAFGKNGESGAIGFPWRSKKCDFEQAADDAFAAGERELGWFWKCRNPNLYKQFKGKNVEKQEAMDRCHASMVGNVSALKTIETLKEQLTTSEELRKIERNRHEKLTEELNTQCDESKDRIADACRK